MDEQRQQEQASVGAATAQSRDQIDFAGRQLAQGQAGGEERQLARSQQDAQEQLRSQLGQMEGADMQQVNKLAQGAKDLEHWASSAEQSGREQADAFLHGFQQTQDATRNLLGKVHAGEMEAKRLAQGQEAMGEKLLEEHLSSASAQVQEQIRSELAHHNA